MVRVAIDSSLRAGSTCARPVRRGGHYVRCWSRDYATCASCASLNALYTRRLIGSGMEDETNSFYLLTLAAPSFGSVHRVPHGPKDALVRCSCGSVHRFGSDVAGVPLDASRYRYRDEVRWNHYSTTLWRSTWVSMSAKLPDAEFCAVREYQNRGALHLHIIVRVPASYDAAKVLPVLRKAHLYSSGGFNWGAHSDAQLIRSDGAADTVRYLSKVIGYATKTLGHSVETLPQPRREFYGRLDAASVALGYSHRAVEGFGYGGQMMTKSAGWSDLTRDELLSEAREYANNFKNVARVDDVSELVEARRLEKAHELAAALGDDENFEVNELWLSGLRGRFHQIFERVE